MSECGGKEGTIKGKDTKRTRGQSTREGRGGVVNWRLGENWEKESSGKEETQTRVERASGNRVVELLPPLVPD